MKRKIVKWMVVSRKDGNTLTKMSEQPILEFQDSEKVRGILNKAFLLIIMTIITNCNVSEVLIDGRSFCDIMYSNIFENTISMKEKLWPYEGSDLYAFNDTKTRT